MKEFIFETNETRKLRKKRKRYLYSLIALFIILVFPISHHYYSRNLIQSSQEKFFQRSPDLIAVFTGDSGRINRALKLSLEHQTSKILISGVYDKNNLNVLLKAHFGDQYSEGDENQLSYFSRLIELDFEAQNTYQNVAMTLEFLKKQESFQNILIVSSDYHIPRINLIIKKLNTDPNYQFYFEGTKTRTSFSYLRNIFIEHLKVLKVVWEKF